MITAAYCSSLLDHETWKITTKEDSDLAESISLVN